MRKVRAFGFLGSLFGLRSANRLSSGTDSRLAMNDSRASALNGSGLLEDWPEAIARSRSAAEEGDPSAQNILGLRFASGRGVLRSSEEARQWFQRAAEQGEADAQFNLGNLFYSDSVRHLAAEAGEARIQAYMWFHLAAAQGHSPATASCETLNLQLTDSELLEGTRRAHTFQCRKEVTGKRKGQ